MNAESEMAGADGLGAEPVSDTLDALAKEIGYSDGADDDDDETGGVDALIDYKNVLEDRCRSREAALAEIAAGVPRGDQSNSTADFMEATAATLDRFGVERPERYAE